MSSTNIVHVAVAVIQNSDGQCFIAKRPATSHQGGLWEFPGGKVEKNETSLEALKRELFEEIGISITKTSPLIKIYHDYIDKSVLLEVFKVSEYAGNAFGKEEQETRWINVSELSKYQFPLANIPIIKSIQLPDKYMITGDFSNDEMLFKYIQTSINKGIKLIQFRAKHLKSERYFKLAKEIYFLCEKEKVKLLLNSSLENYNKYSAENFSHGIHLNSDELTLFSNESHLKNHLVSASTHSNKEILVAVEKNIDFIVLSPVNKTLSHPDAIPLGWEKFNTLTEKAKIPVYALGGMTVKHLDTAKANGAQGIAAIGEFWGD